jgi:hypothetical protein
MSSLSADLRTTFSKLAAECLPLSHCTTGGDAQPSPQTVIALQIPWKEVFWPQISRCLLQNPKRSPLIGGLGAVYGHSGSTGAEGIIALFKAIEWFTNCKRAIWLDWE